MDLYLGLAPLARRQAALWYVPASSSAKDSLQLEQMVVGVTAGATDGALGRYSYTQSARCDERVRRVSCSTHSPVGLALSKC